MRAAPTAPAHESSAPTPGSGASGGAATRHTEQKRVRRVWRSSDHARREEKGQVRLAEQRPCAQRGKGWRMRFWQEGSLRFGGKKGSVLARR
eukprot:359356-Chlamydomonas_euryale.AAC.2